MSDERPVHADHRVQHKYPAGVRFCALCGGEMRSREVLPDRKQFKVCARCGFVDFPSPKLVAGCLIVERSKVLLLKRGIEPALGRWTFPGGYVDLGEHPKDAAVREAAEEVLMQARAGELLGVYWDSRNPVAVVVVYLAEPGPVPPAVSDEATAFGYFAGDEIPWSDLAFDTTRQALIDWVGRLKRGG
jgi:ADP-ribose pyrophosphatase YjhB (NUDIX family)